MQIPILIEPIEGGGFRARAGEPFADCVEGATAEEATRLIEEHLLHRIRNGGRVAVVTLPSGVPSAPSELPFPADELYKTDPSFRAWQGLIAENRRLEDEMESSKLEVEREAEREGS
jgi:hypothetical protein